jgi:hypothetical protein
MLAVKRDILSSTLSPAGRREQAARSQDRYILNTEPRSSGQFAKGESLNRHHASPPRGRMMAALG